VLAKQMAMAAAISPERMIRLMPRAQLKKSREFAR